MRIAAVLCLLAGGLRADTIIFSENFDSVSPGTYSVGANVGNFVVGTGNIDVVGVGFFGFLCTGSASVNCADLNGTTTGSLLSPTLSLSAGSYLLTFVLNGAQINGSATSTTVALGSLYNETFNLTASQNNDISRTITVAAATSAVLSFMSNNSGFDGSKLDTVVLTRMEAIPEPATSLFFFSGISTLLMGLRRRTR